MSRQTAGLDLPVSVNPGSVAWALETFGYFFMSLALVVAAAVFGGGRRQLWIRRLFLANGLTLPALAESAVFIVNHGRCPLTGLVENLGAANGRVSDIFLPRWFADRIPHIFGPQLVIGIVLLAWRARFAPSTRSGGTV